MAITLKAEIRERVGSRASRKLRANGAIPCSLQDSKAAVIAFSINEDEFLSARRAHENLFDLAIDGSDHPAVVRELQWDYLTDRIIHVEFKAVVRGVKVESEVSLTFIGHPSGVLNALVNTITISSIPSLIPDTIEVVIGHLSEGEHLDASALTMPEGCELVTDGDTTVATVSGADAAIEAGAIVEEGEESEAGEAGEVGEAGTDGADEPKAE
jgi:large subunit ribosomal protein L25